MSEVIKKVLKIVKDNGEDWQVQREHIKSVMQYIIRNTSASVKVTIDIDTAKGCTQYTMFLKALEFIASKSSDLKYEEDDYGNRILTVNIPAHIFKEYLEDRLADVITDARMLADFLAGFETLVNLVSENKE